MTKRILSVTPNRVQAKGAKGVADGNPGGTRPACRGRDTDASFALGMNPNRMSDIPDDDLDEAEFDLHHPDVIVGSLRACSMAMMSWCRAAGWGLRGRRANSSLLAAVFAEFVHYQLSETAMPISHPVEQIASFLQSSSATPKQKLIIGGKLLWAAMIFSKDWPPELLDRARMVYKPLLKHGNMKRTLEQMDEKDASRCLAQFTKEVTQLATDIEQTGNQHPRKS